MLFWGRKHTSSHYGALIDIASGSIGIAIVVSDASKPLPRIIFNDRIPFRQYTESNPEEILNVRKVREALLSASLILSSEGADILRTVDAHGEISKLFVTCSSPWAYTLARSAQYQDDEPFRITKNTLTELVTGAEREMLVSVAQETHRRSDAYAIVEKATVDITINDYPVTKPFGLKGASLGLSHIAGLIPKDLLDIVEETQEKLFAKAEMRAHTYMLVMYCISRDIFPEIHNLCIVDITGEVTEFGIMEHNLLIDNTYIPYGTNTIVRMAAKERGNPLADLLTQLSEYSKDVCADSTPLGSAISAYKEELTHGINSILEHRNLPKNILLTSHGAYQDVFKNIFEDTLAQLGLHDHTIITLPDSVVTEVMPDTNPDVYLSISARFFHKLHGCADISDA